MLLSEKNMMLNNNKLYYCLYIYISAYFPFYMFSIDTYVYKYTE